MKKKDLSFKTLALAGLATGMLVSIQAVPANPSTPPSANEHTKSTNSSKDGMSDFEKNFEKYDGNITYKDFTEKDLLLELNPAGQRLYNSLTPQGKELAREVASQTCNGQNKCEGFNGCETIDHTCAGKGKCQGTGKCAISDKNLAVKLVADKMKNKRENVLK